MADEPTRGDRTIGDDLSGLEPTLADGPADRASVAAPDPILAARAPAAPELTCEQTPDPGRDETAGPTLDGGEPGPSGRAVPVIAGYQILGELGRGGMGVVYLARQVLLNRPCALKMILAGAHADAVASLRFLAEAEAVARLRHPNVVQIHHVGEADGLPYFELEYVDGGSLDRTLDGTPWPARRAAQLVESLARGVAEAHRLGIVHRDLKPANILLAADGTPKITDFGLAKSLNVESGLTATESILGSPSYMAPEQAEGRARQVGPTADVHALGAILYELLTGRPPFKGATVLETIDQVKNTEPVPPSRLIPGIPRDLETIALACLQKQPERRYASAAELAEDLGRFLGGEPIRARPVLLWERGLKWARRRPVIAGLLALVHVLLAVSLGVFIWSYVEINRSLAQAREARDLAESLSRNERLALDEARTQTKLATDRAEDLAAQDAINRVNLAYREVQDDNVALAEDLLHGCPPGRRGWEWHYVKRLANLERVDLDVGNSVNAVAYSPDGQLLAFASGQPIVGAGGGIESADAVLVLRDSSSGEQRTLGTRPGSIFGLAFSPDGRRIALASGFYAPRVEGRVSVLDAATGAVLWSHPEPGRIAMSLAFGADGESLAVGYGLYSEQQASWVKLWDAATGQELARLPGPAGGVNKVAFHPDGRRLAVAGSGVVEVWDVEARARLRELKGHAQWVYTLAYSPDGRWLASGGWDRTVRLWDAETGAERLGLFGHRGFVLDLAFSPDGTRLATTSEDRGLKLWEIPSGRELETFHGHTDFVQTVAFGPGGREIATGGMDGTLKVWDLRTSRPVVIDRHNGWVLRLAIRGDGRRAYSESVVFGQSRLVWDPHTGEDDPELSSRPPGELAGFTPGVSNGTLSASSPDGTLVARVSPRSGQALESRSRDYEVSAVVIAEAATGRPVHTLLGHSADVSCLAFSPDGKRLATASFDRTIKLWDVASGREVFTLRGHTAGVMALVFSSDGNRLVSGGIDWTARVWDATPLPAEVLTAHEARYRAKLDALVASVDESLDPWRALILAEQGRWAEAAAIFNRLIEDNPKYLTGWRHLFLSLLRAGDREGLRRACDALLAQFAGTTSPGLANNIAWYCVVAPDGPSDPEAPVRLAQLAVDGEPGSHVYLNTLGAALYRAGRLEEAIARLEEGIAIRKGSLPDDWPFLAMAHHRLGHAEEARRWLAKYPARGGEPAAFSWAAVESETLRREAETLILGDPPAAP